LLTRRITNQFLILFQTTIKKMKLDCLVS